MFELAVTTGYLANLETTQDEAADKAGSAAMVASNLKSELWVSHGVISGASNVAFTNAEAARRAAGEAMKKASTDLAVKLRAARDAYGRTDEQAGQHIDQQLLAG